MFHPIPQILSLISISILIGALPEDVIGQYRGNRSDDGAVANHDISALPLSDPRFISVEGAAEIRLQPSNVRMVLAAISEADTASECKTEAEQLMTKLKREWGELGIKHVDIVEDFISILPIYAFEEQKWHEHTVLMEVLKKFRIQINLHVRLKNDRRVQQALDVAFANDVTDIVNFDYWHPNLSETKTEALRQALTVARAKAEIMFDPSLFKHRPRLVNLTENHAVIFPKQMYNNYVNTIDSTIVTHDWKQSIPRVRVPRPQTSFYRGPRLTGDTLSAELPMEPKISVIAKVQLFFQSSFSEPFSRE